MQTPLLRLAFLIAGAIPAVAAPASLPTVEPPAWRLAHPDAQILAGVDFQSLSTTSTGAALAKRFAAALGADLVDRAQSLLLSSSIDTRGRRSDLLLLSGNFELSRLRKLATTEGAKVTSYKGVEIAAPPGANMGDPHLAWIDGSTVLIGNRPVIIAAADRAKAQLSGMAAINPLFSRAGDLAATFPVWVACDTLPEGLAPAALDALLDDADGIQGIDLAFGIAGNVDLNFWIWTGSELAAESALKGIQSAAADPRAKFLLRPFLAGGSAELEGSTLVLGASLPAGQAVSRIAPLLAAFAFPIAAAEPAPAAPAVPAKSEPPPPPKKLFVRIEGLDTGAISIPFEKQ